MKVSLAGDSKSVEAAIRAMAVAFDERDAVPAPNVVEGIVQAIAHDVSGRRGLGQEWEHIEDDIMHEELLPEWRRLVAARLTAAGLMPAPEGGKPEA